LLTENCPQGVTSNPIRATIANTGFVYRVPGNSSVIVPRKSSPLATAIAIGILLQTHHAQAQWWSHAPADFEECADIAEKAPTKEAKASALIECNAKFAGRRKPGGGYTYYDFMQNRSFDIAGPNPTPEEQRQIDEQYTAFLDKERRSRIAAAVAAGPPLPAQPPQLQLLQRFPQPQQAALRSARVPLPVEAPNKRSNFRSRNKAANCPPHAFLCWPRLSESINDLKKKLFSSYPARHKGG
jgi:hypothetical protein